MEILSVPNYCPCQPTALLKVPLKVIHFLRVGGIKGASQVAVIKNLPANAGDARDSSWILGSGRLPGVGNGKPLQYSCLGNPINRGSWWGYSHGAGRVLPQD